MDARASRARAPPIRVRAFTRGLDAPDGGDGAGRASRTAAPAAFVFDAPARPRGGAAGGARSRTRRSPSRRRGPAGDAARRASRAAGRSTSTRTAWSRRGSPAAAASRRTFDLWLVAPRGRLRAGACWRWRGRSGPSGPTRRSGRLGGRVPARPGRPAPASSATSARAAAAAGRRAAASSTRASPRATSALGPAVLLLARAQEIGRLATITRKEGRMSEDVDAAACAGRLADALNGVLVGQTRRRRGAARRLHGRRARAARGCRPASARRCSRAPSRRALGVRFSRIQFTPDLMPTDVTGRQRLRPGDARLPADAAARCSPRC